MKYTVKIAFLVIIAGIVTLVVVGYTVVRGYHSSKHFEPSKCVLLGINQLGYQPCEFCFTTYTTIRVDGKKQRTGKRKCLPSSYPCIGIAVGVHRSTEHQYVAMYSHDITVYLKSEMCAYISCGPGVYNNELDILKELEMFNETHKEETFPCFYSMDEDHVIGYKPYSFAMAVHGTLWPSVCIVAAIVMLGVELCGQTNSPEQESVLALKMRKLRFEQLQRDQEMGKCEVEDMDEEAGLQNDSLIMLSHAGREERWVTSSRGSNC